MCARACVRNLPPALPLWHILFCSFVPYILWFFFLYSAYAIQTLDAANSVFQNASRNVPFCGCGLQGEDMIVSILVHIYVCVYCVCVCHINRPAADS